MGRKRRNKNTSRGKRAARVTGSYVRTLESDPVMRPANISISKLMEDRMKDSMERSNLDYIRSLELDYLTTLDLSPTGNPVTDLIRELLRLACEVLTSDRNSGRPFGHEGCFVNPKIYSRCVEIGKELSSLTKDDEGFFEWFFNCDLLSIPREFRHEIFRVWNGVNGDSRLEFFV